MTVATTIAIEDILTCGIDLERQAVDFYRNLANMKRDAYLKELFSVLAQEEAKHESIFRRLLSDLEAAQEALPGADDYMQKLCAAMIKSASPEDVALNLNTDLEIIDLAISKEKEAIFFYHELKNIVEEQSQNLLEGIILEERLHIVKLLDMREKIS